MNVNFENIDNFIKSKNEEISDFVDKSDERGQQLIYEKTIPEGSFVFELSYLGKRHKLDSIEGEFTLVFRFEFKNTNYKSSSNAILLNLWEEYHPNSGSIPYKDEIGQPPYCRIKDGISKSEIKETFNIL